MNNENIKEERGDEKQKIAAQAVNKELVETKLLEAFTTPGLKVEFNQDEAASVGAFVEDALSSEDAEKAAFKLKTQEG